MTALRKKKPQWTREIVDTYNLWVKLMLVPVFLMAIPICMHMYMYNVYVYIYVYVYEGHKYQGTKSQTPECYFLRLP